MEYNYITVFQPYINECKYVLIEMFAKDGEVIDEDTSDVFQSEVTSLSHWQCLIITNANTTSDNAALQTCACLCVFFVVECLAVEWVHCLKISLQWRPK